MEDCNLTLEIVFKLDLINSIVGMCYAANCSIRDALIYSTGGMAISSICAYAHNIDARYMWTRCDWKPPSFKGAIVSF